MKIDRTPFRMIHGSPNQINPPELTERFYNELINIGAKQMKYSNYSGYGNTIWGKAASEPA